MKSCFFVVLFCFLVGCPSPSIQKDPFPPVTDPANTLVGIGKGADVKTATNEAYKSLSQQLVVNVNSRYTRILQVKVKNEKEKMDKLTQSVLRLVSKNEIRGVKMETKPTVSGTYARALLNKADYMSSARENVGKLLGEAKQDLAQAKKSKREGQMYDYMVRAGEAYTKANTAYTTYLTIVGLGGKTGFDKDLYRETFKVLSDIRSKLRIVIQINERWENRKDAEAWQGKRASEYLVTSALKRGLAKIGVPVSTEGSSGDVISIYLRGRIQAYLDHEKWVPAKTMHKIKIPGHNNYYYHVRDNIQMVFGRKVLFSSSDTGNSTETGDLIKAVRKSRRLCAREVMTLRAKQILPHIQKAIEKMLPLK